MASAIDTLLPLFKATVDGANEIAERIISATSAKSDEVKDAIENSDDPALVEYRANRDKLEAGIAKAKERLAALNKDAREHARSVLPGLPEDFDLDTAKGEFLAKRREATAARTFMLTLVQGD